MVEADVCLDGLGVMGRAVRGHWSRLHGGSGWGCMGEGVDFITSAPFPGSPPAQGPSHHPMKRKSHLRRCSVEYVMTMAVCR